jgi:hypothetical protein
MPTATTSPTYHFETSNLIFSFGMKVLMLLIVGYLLALNLPAAPFPANKVRAIFQKAPVSA